MTPAQGIRMTTDLIFNVAQSPNSLSISLSSTMENIDRADVETKNFLKHQDLEIKTFDVCLVMREALTNAVKHGNHFDATKIVKYSIKFQDKILTMEIEDQGEGFDWKMICKRDPKPEADHGRGFSIMEQYFTEFSFNDKGNRIVLTNYCQ